MQHPCCSGKDDISTHTFHEYSLIYLLTVEVENDVSNSMFRVLEIMPRINNINVMYRALHQQNLPETDQKRD